MHPDINRKLDLLAREQQLKESDRALREFNHAIANVTPCELSFNEMMKEFL